MPPEMTGTIFDAATGKPLGTNEKTLSFDSLNVTVDKKPSIETAREVRVEYSDSFGEAYRSLSVETFATFKELRKLVRDLIGGAE